MTTPPPEGPRSPEALASPRCPEPLAAAARPTLTAGWSSRQPLPVPHVGVTPETGGLAGHPDTAAVPGSIRDRRVARSSGNHAGSGVVRAHALKPRIGFRSRKQGVSCFQEKSDMASGNRPTRETPGPLSRHRIFDPALGRIFPAESPWFVGGLPSSLPAPGGSP